jgi:ssDNA-binding Zn-finger/Zn-ribbon topoisomerase 1
MTTEVTAEHYFGGCPECGDNDGYVNIGADHWFLCDTHKTCWPIGSNLFSIDDTEEPQQAAAAKVARYRTVVDDLSTFPIRGPRRCTSAA